MLVDTPEGEKRFAADLLILCTGRRTSQWSGAGSAGTRQRGLCHRRLSSAPQNKGCGMGGVQTGDHGLMPAHLHHRPVLERVPLFRVPTSVGGASVRLLPSANLNLVPHEYPANTIWHRPIMYASVWAAQVRMSLCQKVREVLFRVLLLGKEERYFLLKHRHNPGFSYPEPTRFDLRGVESYGSLFFSPLSVGNAHFPESELMR